MSKELRLNNVYNLYSASSNPTNVVVVIVWVIPQWSDNISGIWTRAIEKVNVFEMKFRWQKDIEFKKMKGVVKEVAVVQMYLCILFNQKTASKLLRKVIW